MGDTFIRHIALLGFEKRFVPSQHYVSSGDCGQMAPGLWASVDMGPLKTRQPTSLPAPLPSQESFVPFPAVSQRSHWCRAVFLPAALPDHPCS